MSQNFRISPIPKELYHVWILSFQIPLMFFKDIIGVKTVEKAKHETQNFLRPGKG